MKIKAQKMGLFDVDVAKEHGLNVAVVFQELLQQAIGFSGNAVMNIDGNVWYRFDDNVLRETFPYYDLDEVYHIIGEAESNNLFRLWRSMETDYLWITWGGELQ